jgi:hypothetical protein
MPIAGDEIEDDLSISDDVRMLRRIPPTNSWIANHRPSSSNFEVRAPGEGLSVTAWLASTDLEDVLRKNSDFGVICVTAAQLRAVGFKLIRVSLEGNLNHCECYGKPTHGQRRRLANLARWVVVPGDYDPEDYQDLEQF